MRRINEMTGRDFANWAVTIGGLALLAFVIWLLFVKTVDRYTIYAYFTNSDGIIKDSDVKVGGVPGGQVTNLQVVYINHQPVAKLTLSMKPEGAPIGAGATARVRPANLLGEKYVDLNVGDLSHPQPSGTSIPLSRTAAPVELDDVLNLLQPNVRASLRLLINEAGVGMDGQGTNFNDTLQQLPPALDQTSEVVNEVAQQDQTLKVLISTSDRVIGSINGRRHDLQSLISSADQALAVTARNQQALGRTLETAPSTLSQAQTTLGTLNTTATNLVPASRDLRTASGPLAATLAALPGFQASAQNTLSTIRSVAPTITQLGTQGSPIIARLKPTVDRLNTFAQNLAPNIDTLSNGGMAQLLGLMSGWTRTIQTRDSIGHVFRVHLIVDPQALQNSLSFLGSTSSSARRRHATRSAPQAKAPAVTRPSVAAPQTRPAAAQPASPLPIKLPPIDLPKPVQNLVNGVTGVLTGSSSGAQTSSSSTQANGVTQLLNYLFGS
jgi:phospholipid/cholesterol/gamma-HCH transport system substrate-binding protein